MGLAVIAVGCGPKASAPVGTTSGGGEIPASPSSAPETVAPATEPAAAVETPTPAPTPTPTPGEAPPKPAKKPPVRPIIQPTGPIPKGAPLPKSGKDAVGIVTTDGWTVLADDGLALGRAVDERVRKLASANAFYEFRMDGRDGSLGRQEGDVTIRSPRVHRLETPVITNEPKVPIIKRIEIANGGRVLRLENDRRALVPFAPRPLGLPEDDPASIVFRPLGTTAGGIGEWVAAEKKRGAVVRVEKGPGTDKIVRINVIGKDRSVTQFVLAHKERIPLSVIRYPSNGGRTMYTLLWDLTPGRTFPRADFTVK